MKKPTLNQFLLNFHWEFQEFWKQESLHFYLKFSFNLKLFWQFCSFMCVCIWISHCVWNNTIYLHPTGITVSWCNSFLMSYLPYFWFWHDVRRANIICWQCQISWVDILVSRGLNGKQTWLQVQFVFHLYSYLDSSNYIPAVQPRDMWLNTTIWCHFKPIKLLEPRLTDLSGCVFSASLTSHLSPTSGQICF